MSKIIKCFLEGMGQVLVISPDRSYRSPKAGFERDSIRLKSDAAKLGSYMRMKVNAAKHDEQANYR